MRISEEAIILSWDNVMTPKVSICCITYNHEKYIKDALNGLLMQNTNFPFEILIHDDASNDLTQDIIKQYEKVYPRIIKPIYQQENQYSKCSRINIKYNYPRAKGKYIALCEGDDYWTDPEKLQKQVDFMENNNDYTICYHNTESISFKNKKINRIVNTKSDIFTIEDIIMGKGGHTSSFVFRKTVLSNIPKFVSSSDIGDYPLRLLCAIQGKSGYIDEVMSVYRKHLNYSWSGEKLDIMNKINRREKIVEILNDFDNETNNKYTKYTYIKKVELIKKELYSISRKNIIKYKQIKNILKNIKMIDSIIIVSIITLKNIKRIIYILLKS